MLPRTLWLLCLTIVSVKARTATTNDFYSTSFSTLANPTSSDFTGSQYTYVSYTGQSTVATSSRTETSNGTKSQSTRSTKSHSLTLIGGNGNATSTSSASPASNTVPCNNYPQFCNRQYSNITEVCSHNSFFVVKNNAGSNQALPVEDQLNDGVRMRELRRFWFCLRLY